MFVKISSLFTKLVRLNPRLSLEGSKLVEGTKNLANDASKALLVLVPIVAGVCITYFAIRKMNADEHEAVSWQKRIIATIVCAVIGIVAGTIITVVISYYR